LTAIVGPQTELSEDTMDETDGAIDMPGNPLDQMIERWWDDHFPGSAVARDTASWNVAHAAKENLKRLLVPALSLSQAKAGDQDLQGSM
jgi:hypothetical protein